MERKILDQLLVWKNCEPRLPLVLMGARQVGKTHIISSFGSQHFRKVHTFNFEEHPKLKEVFEPDLDISRILKELRFLSEEDISSTEDLVFFDEIQSCPKALTALKYFYEKMPELAVCSAGSLLGVTLNEESFPVGKVTFMYLHPMDFEEFLEASDKNLFDSFHALLNQEIRPQLVHDSLFRVLKDYYVTGGLPRVVLAYKQNMLAGRAPFLEVRRTQSDIITSYLSDFSKHAGTTNAVHIRSVFESIPMQLSRSLDGTVSRFRFNEVSPRLRGYRRLAGPIDWLVSCGLVHKVRIAKRSELPLKSFCEDNMFKLYMFDTGLLGCMLDLPEKAIVTEDYGMAKGYFAENFVCQALVASRNLIKPLYAWAEGKSEIEFLEYLEDSIVPVEVKSGTRVKAKSLASFKNRYDPRLSIKISAKPVQYIKEQKTLLMPLYLAGHLDIVAGKYLEKLLQ